MSTNKAPERRSRLPLRLRLRLRSVDVEAVLFFLVSAFGLWLWSTFPS